MTQPVLSDVCKRVTGRKDYTFYFDNTGYNIGRLAILDYQGKRTYISFSELEIRSRNSSFQSFPSALSRFILEENKNKEICFYFHPSTIGNFETPYFNFMYRLMKTAKVIFLNDDEYLSQPILPFSSPEDIIIHKNSLRSKNSGNRSTYITRASNNNLQIYGKTYGANKYETTILCHAFSGIATSFVELYEIAEGGLTTLPQTSKEAIESLGIVQIFTSNRSIEKIDFEVNDSLRSAEYIYNLLEKLGNKKCAFCGCEIPQIIQGAHIWPVSDIKKDDTLTQDEKLTFALDGNNGLWLCQNHHKLLDLNFLRISEDGSLKYITTIDDHGISFVHDITKNNQLSNEIINEKFLEYLSKRNMNIQEELYNEFTY